MTIETCHRARLVVHKMVLKNFKSYAGTQEIGPFHQSFSAIVGPNGSGKSNVIDAILFVFGYRATKMRQPRASDLIHFSEAFPSLESCSVQIFFHYIQELYDGSGGARVEDVPSSEFTIERIAYKNASRGTEYLLNSKIIPWKDLAAILKDKGIDLDHNRFLILQGEVESIALMKPKASSEHEEGLLEYLEDIIGTNKYKALIEDALQSLTLSAEQVSLKLSQLRAVEKEMMAKEALKREAEDYLQQENQITNKKSLYYQIIKYDNQRELLKSKQEQDSLQSQLQKTEEELASSSARVSSMAKMESRVSKEIQALEQELSKHIAAIKDLEKKDIRMQEDKKHAKSKWIKANKEKGSLNEQRHAFDCLKTEVEVKTRQLEALKKSLAPAEAELDRIRYSLKGKRVSSTKDPPQYGRAFIDKTDMFRDKLDQLRGQLLPHTEKKNAVHAKLEMAQCELDMLKEKSCVQNHLKSDLATELESAKLAHEDAASRLLEDEKKMKNAKAEIASLVQNRKALLEAQGQLEGHVQSLKSQIMDMKDAILGATSGNKILDALLGDSKLQGIYGRLRDLGAIDPKYEAALQAATGALDHIVVDTAQTGQRCIEFLKLKQLGRATFIILEKMPSDMESKRSTLPVNVPRLFDLIVPNEACLSPAFYYAVRDTLVASTMDEANHIAFGRSSAAGAKFRVTTLDGKLIDKSGTMSGGGPVSQSKAESKKPGAGGSSVLRSKGPTLLKRGLEEMEKEFRSKSNDLASTKYLVSEVGSRMEILNLEVQKTYQINIIKGQKETQFLAERVSELDTLLSEQSGKKSNASEIKKMNELESLVGSLSREEACVQEQEQPIKDLIQKEENKMLEAGGIQFKSQLSHVEGIKEQIETTESRLSKAHQECRSLEKAIAKLEGEAKKYEKEGKELEMEVTSIDKELEKNLQSATTHQKERESIEDKLQAKLDETSTFRSELSCLQSSIKDLRHQQADLQNQVSHSGDRLKKISVNISLADQELCRLKLHETDNSQACSVEAYDEKTLVQHHKRTERLQVEIQTLQDKLCQSKPYLGAIDEHKALKEAFTRQDTEASALIAKGDALQGEYESLKKNRYSEFMKGFQAISMKLKEMYQMITLGGNAELELVDAFDPFSEGVLFSVMPPSKSWKNISDLSGGEKTLSSLALVFALHHYKPTPIYFMDEIDAALDFKNVSIVANYIKERTRDSAQFIVISLRYNMFELADNLVGIFKLNHCSKSILYDCSTLLTPAPNEHLPCS